MLQWSVKDYLLKAGICRLAEGVRPLPCLPLRLWSSSFLQDMVAMKKALEKYKSVSDGFSTTRECMLLESLSEAVESLSAEDFTAAVAEFDKVTRLDGWKTTILLEVKEKLEADDAIDVT